MTAPMANDMTGRGSDKFMLRLPDGMRDRLKESAEANMRSMNAEIVSRLEWSLKAGTLAMAVHRAKPNEELKAKAYAVTERIAERLAEISAELDALATTTIEEATASAAEPAVLAGQRTDPGGGN